MNNYRTYLSNTAGVLSLLKLSKDDLSGLFGQEFALMKGYSQNNPHHCYDLLEHTVRTIISLDFTGVTAEERFELKMAALYHDVGKPQVAFAKDGRTVFYNHAIKSAEIARNALITLGVNKLSINRICFFISYHDAFISFKLDNEIINRNNPYLTTITRSNVVSEIEQIQSQVNKSQGFAPSFRDFQLLLKLCYADNNAQSELVFWAGRKIDSKEQKIERLKKIQDIISELEKRSICSP